MTPPPVSLNPTGSSSSLGRRHLIPSLTKNTLLMAAAGEGREESRGAGEVDSRRAGDQERKRLGPGAIEGSRGAGD
eukprot:763660-Hanusia_phi.AAC.2